MPNSLRNVILLRCLIEPEISKSIIASQFNHGTSEGTIMFSKFNLFQQFKLIFIASLSVFLSACSDSDSDSPKKDYIDVSVETIQVFKQAGLMISEEITFEYSGKPDLIPTPNTRYSNVGFDVMVISETSDSLTLRLVYPNPDLVGDSVRFIAGDLQQADLDFLDVPVRVIDTVEINRTNLEFAQSLSANASSLNLEIMGDNQNWEIESKVDWLSFSQTKGTGVASIAIEITAEDEGEYRTEFDNSSNGKCFFVGTVVVSITNE